MSAEQKWFVHIVGPDDVLPKVSRRQAMLDAHEFNAGIMQRLDEHDEDGVYPTAWAVPTPVVPDE